MSDGEKPWDEPQVGDVLTMRDGRKRTVTLVDFFVEYQYTTKNGLRQTVRCRKYTTWRYTASAEVRNGGSYKRAESS